MRQGLVPLELRVQWRREKSTQKSHRKMLHLGEVLCKRDGPRRGMMGKKDPDGESKRASWRRWQLNLQVNLFNLI